MVEIGHVEPADWPTLQEMGRRFYAEAGLEGPFIPESFRTNWKRFTDFGYGFILVAREGRKPVGTLGWFLTPDPCNDQLVATEAFWFVSPEHRGVGLRLLSVFEQAARKQGARRLTMVALASLQSDRLAALYERRGYKPQESHFIKTL